jgi:hypothetical protein
MALHVRWAVHFIDRVYYVDFAVAGLLFRVFQAQPSSPQSGRYGKPSPTVRVSERGNPLAGTVNFVVNLKTAKALGLAIPEPIQLRADEVFRQRPSRLWSLELNVISERQLRSELV